MWVASHGFPFFDRSGQLLGYRGTDIETAGPVPEVNAVLRDTARCTVALEQLSFRERQVLWGVAHGLLNKQIAERCGLAERTVKLHRTSLSRKLAVSSAAGLALFAREVGLTHSSFPAGPFYA